MFAHQIFILYLLECVSCVYNLTAFCHFHSFKRSVSHGSAHASASIRISDVQKVVHERARHKEGMVRERRRMREESWVIILLIQSQPSACCFGNVMSMQPLAISLRLASHHKEVCVCASPLNLSHRQKQLQLHFKKFGVRVKLTQCPNLMCASTWSYICVYVHVYVCIYLGVYLCFCFCPYDWVQVEWMFKWL